MATHLPSFGDTASVDKINQIAAMAKRANPFVEDFVQQSKVHVGLKQFNNNEERLQKVYEKTLALLFKGAKKVIAQNIISTETTEVHRTDKMKQLCISSDGSLLRTEISIEKKPVAGQQCSCGSVAVESQCGYCEKALCSSCQRECQRCQKPFCTHCSLSSSDSSEICVSCYG